MVYLITYDLKNDNRNYLPLYEAIKGTGNWWHYLESVWVVQNNLTAQAIYTKLAPFLELSSDFLLIQEINSPNRYGWLPQNAWDWLNQAK